MYQFKCFNLEATFPEFEKDVLLALIYAKLCSFKISEKKKAVVYPTVFLMTVKQNSTTFTVGSISIYKCDIILWTFFISKLEHIFFSSNFITIYLIVFLVEF